MHTSTDRALDWIVLGDDYGRHPSTTQHLVHALPAHDRVVWVDSLGMRAPRPTLGDVARVAGRVRSALTRPAARASERGPDVHVRPWVAPLHRSRVARALNRVILAAQLDRARKTLPEGGRARVALVTNPVAAHYLGSLGVDSVVYLRLDDHPRLPGVDPELARDAEARLTRGADVHVCTAPALALPGARYRHLPQGVDLAHFAKLPERATPERVLGFFGALAEWLDLELVRAVALRLPDWRLELVGPRLAPLDALEGLPNVRVLPPVRYAELPQAIAHWSAAWIPFRVDELTRGVDPLKAREYLAAGLPVLSTDLPAIASLAEIERVASADDVARALAHRAPSPSPDERARRRASVRDASWHARAGALRGWVIDQLAQGGAR